MGIVASQWLSRVDGIWWVVFGGVGVWFCMWRHRVYTLPIMICCGCCLGLCRGVPVYKQRYQFTQLYGANHILQGTVADDPEYDAQNGTQLKLTNIRWRDKTLTGMVRVVGRTKWQVRRYDVVKVAGKVTPGFGTFVATMNSAVISGVWRVQSSDIAGTIRDAFSDKVRAAIPEPEASLGIGYLVGQKSALPDNLDEAFRTAGLTHVVVASGYNLTILVRLARRLFVKVSKYLAAFFSFLMIGAFIAVTGSSPSMSRAGLVAGLGILTWYYGRKFHPLVLLPFVAAITLIINPSYAWGDLGWQLSFLSFAGVMIVAPLLQRYFFGDKKPSMMRQVFGETLCAQLVTAPVVIMAFGQLSLVAVIANMLILPLVPFAMLLTFIAGVGSLCVPFFAGIAGIPAYFVLKHMTQTSLYAASFSWSQINITANGCIVAIYYVLLVLGCYFAWVKTRLNLRSASIVE